MPRSLDASSPFLALAFAVLLGAMPLSLRASVMLEELTWTEVRDAVAAGRTIVIVPIGGTEQNGPHMALGKHNVRVRLLAQRIAESLGNALVAPVIAYVPEGSIDPPAGHMKYPGTISVSAAAFAGVVESAARSLRHAGFRDVVLIGDHGGYQKELAAIAGRLNREWSASGQRAHAITTYYAVTETEYAQELKRRGITAAEIGEHAGLADTSLTLALAPDLVRKDALASPAARNANGVRGEPARASADLGRVGVDLIVVRTTDAIRAAVRR
jgi:creatinine amidohydrolase/Fe(II)-dependent formamide hydrolase-like protein